jgi:PKD repeat protein
VVGYLAFAGSAAAVPVASFTYSPTEPLTGETVTFTSTSTEATTLDWDLDGDGLCDDSQETVVTRTFESAGEYAVSLCVNGTASVLKQTITVRNRPPFASFTLVPDAPVAREAVTLTSTAVDPDGPIVAQEWDLDGDGAFDDAVGETALYFWRRAGAYPVALRVTDRDGAAAVAQASVVVAKRPPGVLSPAPLVRFAGRPTATGAYLDHLTVTAPKGTHVGVRCKGGNCPYKRKRIAASGKRIVLRALQRSFAAGTVIEIRVTKTETIGKYTRLRIRAGRSPARVDGCLRPGRPNKPYRC